MCLPDTSSRTVRRASSTTIAGPRPPHRGGVLMALGKDARLASQRILRRRSLQLRPQVSARAVHEAKK